MRYQRERVEGERSIEVGWSVEVDGQSWEITTTLQPEDIDDWVGWSWREWDRLDDEDDKVEIIKSHISNLFEETVGFHIEEIKDVGSAYAEDQHHTLDEKLGRGWLKPVPSWDKHLELEEE